MLSYYLSSVVDYLESPNRSPFRPLRIGFVFRVIVPETFSTLTRRINVKTLPGGVDRFETFRDRGVQGEGDRRKGVQFVMLPNFL